eukprot:TRINITY_DN37536_c0_g1_i1.p1 TRINITY_DN37536_c0_g1~~TRINITY_DN37536_c0_g1_i1.p1  ORF type:complete len:249 (+),score=26.45 TRINITY_DN37536_c0_g1_i1:184-930(+)
MQGNLKSKRPRTPSGSRQDVDRPPLPPPPPPPPPTLWSSREDVWRERCQVQVLPDGHACLLVVKMGRCSFDDQDLIDWCEWMHEQLWNCHPPSPELRENPFFEAPLIDFSENCISASGFRKLCSLLESYSVVVKSCDCTRIAWTMLRCREFVGTWQLSTVHQCASCTCRTITYRCKGCCGCLPLLPCTLLTLHIVRGQSNLCLCGCESNITIFANPIRLMSWLSAIILGSLFVVASTGAGQVFAATLP